MMAVEKPVMLVAIDESKRSMYALEWALERLFLPFPSYHPFKIVLVHAKPSATPLGVVGPGSTAVVPYVEEDLRKLAAKVTQEAIDLCNSKSVRDVQVEVMEGDAKSVLCEAVEKHKASLLVVGSRGNGVLKRAVVGSVSDYCAHHAHCTVMIVKKPKIIR